MEFLIANWYLIVGAISVVGMLIYHIRKFIKSPSKSQFEKLRRWLLAVVIEAERALGSGAGELKLSLAYGMFSKRYKWLSLILPYSVFKLLVEEALETMRELLEKEEAIKKYVNNEIGDSKINPSLH